MSHRMDEYTQELASLHYTQEQKDRLAAVAAHLSQQDTPQIAHRRRPVGRTLLITVAVCALLIGTASATGMLKTIAEWFSPIFGTSSTQQADIMNEIGTPVGVSDTDNGITITAEAIIRDPYVTCVAYTISWDDTANVTLPENFLSSPPSEAIEGATFLAFERFDDVDTFASDRGIGFNFYDSNPNDNELQMFQFIHTIDPITLDTFKIQLQNLRSVIVEDENNITYHPIAEGTWELSFPVDIADSSVKLPGEKALQINDFNVTLDNITLSPIGLHLDIIFHSMDRVPEHAVDLLDFPMTLTKMDGTTLSLKDYSTVSNGSTLYVTISLDEIIPLEDMQSISIGDITYDIPHN